MGRGATVVQSENELPLHLKDRNPFRLRRVDMMLRLPRQEVIADDGQVLMAGAIEFTTQITPNQLTDVCDPVEVWKSSMAHTTRFSVVYDPDIQRGEREGKGGSLTPNVNVKQIESMMEDIQLNQFECPPLMWNLRAGGTMWAYVEGARELLIYQGVATRPDTNHRHHAIIGMHQKYRRWVEETESERMENYNPQRAYPLIIHTDSFEGEARKFFVYNTKGTDVPASKAHYVISRTTNPNAHAKLARELMDGSGLLGSRNVEVVQSVLSKNSAKIVLFYTLVRGMQSAYPALPIEEGEYRSLLQYLIEFVAELGRVRPREIGLLSLQQRQRVRVESVADQAITWLAYLRLSAWVRQVYPADWREAMGALAREYVHGRNDADDYRGDLFSRMNPLWREKGILALTDKGTFRVISNRHAQEQVYVALRDLIRATMDVRAAQAVDAPS